MVRPSRRAPSTWPCHPCTYQQESLDGSGHDGCRRDVINDREDAKRKLDEDGETACMKRMKVLFEEAEKASGSSCEDSPTMRGPPRSAAKVATRTCAGPPWSPGDTRSFSYQAGLLLLLMQLGSACSAPNPHIKVRELDSGILEVDGPLAGPFDTSEELAAHACELLGNQPGADAGHGRLGKEYCALHYFAVETQKYYLSYLSDIGGDGPDGIKHCTVPMTINAPTQKEILILGPAHSHPHNREFSAQDMGAGRPAGWSPHGVSKIQEKRTGRIWERHLYVFHKNKLGVCFSYRYNYSNRLVHALREGAWVPIGKATGKWGAFEKFEGQDWLP